MSVTTTAATIEAAPGFWGKRVVNGKNEYLPIIAWSIPVSGAAEPIVLEQGKIVGTQSGNLSEALTGIYVGPAAPTA